MEKEDRIEEYGGEEVARCHGWVHRDEVVEVGGDWEFPQIHQKYHPKWREVSVSRTEFYDGVSVVGKH